MKIEIKILEKPDKNWDKRVIKAGGDIFQTTTYANLQEKCFNMESEYLLAHRGSRIVGQLVVTYGPRFTEYLNRGKMKLFKFFSKHFKIYTFIDGPIILDKKSKKEIYSSFLDYLDSNKKFCFMAKDLALPIKEDKKIYNLFYNKGFYSDAWGTVIIDVRLPLDILWKNIGKKRRNLIRKGEKSDLIMEEIKEKKDYDKVVRRINEMSKRNKIFHENKKYYENLFKILKKSGRGKIWVAKKKERILATIITFFVGKKVIQAMVAHSDYGVKNKIPATDFLEWGVIKWCHDNGYKTYDLAGIRPDSTDKKNVSLRHFKTHWGGEEIHYPWFSKVYSKPKKLFINSLMPAKSWFIKKFSN